MPARFVIAVTLCLAAIAPAAGWAQQQGSDEEVIARFSSAQVSREQLVEFLIQTRGLDALLNLMQLEIAKDLAAQEGITVTQADIQAEKRRTLGQAIAGVAEVTDEQYEDLLRQLLSQQQLSEAEFNVVMETNATLRAMAQPRIEQQINDENLRRAFNLRYGEQVRVRHIALDNLAEVAAVRKRLEAGEDFAQVAAELSREPGTKQTGGALPPFSINSDLPEAFKQAAFNLKVGEVSDPVEAGGYYHLVKLEERIEPQAVKFEDVKEQLRQQVIQEQSSLLMAQSRRKISQLLASGGLQIEHPVLAEQLAQRLEAARPQPVDPEQLKEQMEAERPDAPTTGPADAPATRPAQD